MGASEGEIQYVRENFEKKYADQIASGTYDDRDVRRLRTDDVYVTTFIRGPNRLDEGVNLVHESLRFRKEYEVNDLTEDLFEDWAWEKRGMFYSNRSKSGHRLLYLRTKEHKKEPSQVVLAKKFFIFWLETSFRAYPLEKIVVVFDMSDSGLSNLDMEFIRFILTCFKFYYPTLLEKLLIYEMPWIFNAAWRVIKTWLSQEASSKIKFTTKSDIHTYIDKDLLFDYMGGPCKVDTVVHRPSAGGESLEGRKVTFSDSRDSSDSSDLSRHSTLPNNNNNALHRVTSPRARRNINSSSSDGGSFTGRLLTISPADELTFQIDESSKEPYDVITLTNTLVYPIAFKVKTTAPEKYRVRPSTGVVKPGEAYEVHVFLLPGFLNTVEKDKFLVMAMEVTGDKYDMSLWKSAPKDAIMEHRMRCTVADVAEPGDFNVNVSTEGDRRSPQVSGTSKAAAAASQAKAYLQNKIDASKMDMLIQSNNQLRRRMGWLIVSHIVFFILTLLFFGAFFCLGEDLFSSYLYFPFGYCVSSSWNRRC